MGERRQTADGRILEMQPDGTIIDVTPRGNSTSGAIPIGPRDPNKMRNAAADYGNTVATTQGKALDNAVTAATMPAVIGKSNAEAVQAQQGMRFNGLKDAQFSDALGQFKAGLQIKTQLRDLGALYEKGPGATSGFGGYADFLPSEANQRFDRQANRMRSFAKESTGTTGGENNTAAEMKINLGAYIPSTWDYDKSIEDNFKSADDLAKNGITTAIQRLGGVPDQNGNIFPLGSPEAANLLQGYGIGADGSSPQPWKRGDQNPASAAAMAGSRGNGGPPVFPGNVQGGVRPPNVWQNDGAPMRDVPMQGSAWNAITGNTSTKFERYPDIEEKISQAFMAGASLDQLNQILASDPRSAGGFIRPADYAAGAKLRASGRKGDVTFTVGKDVPMTRREEFSGSPLASGMAGAANMVTMGGVEALAPQQYADQKALNPNAAFVGEVAGAIAGSEGLGWAGRQTAGKILPRLLGGGGKSRVARQVAQDAAYGAGYGGIANGDPVSGAVFGGVGSLLGQGAGKVVGKSLAGLTKSPDAQLLENAGVRMTVGQNLGGLAARTEDRAMSLPGVGDIIRNRRMDAFGDFNRAAQNQAGEPIGASFPNAGNWADELPPQFGQAYDNATAGVRVPLDQQFSTDMIAARAKGANLPPDLAPRFNAAVTNRVLPVAQAGELTGETYQQAMRGLKGYKAEVTKPGFEADYRDALSGVQGALRGQMQRGGGASVVEGLASADQAYRLGKVIQEAQKKAVNGTGSGSGGVFTPAQLNLAATANARKFGGARPFAELGDAGQATLPSTIPDSGTGGRLMQFLLPASLAGTGAGLGGAAGGGDGAAGGAGAGLGLAALLALGGTKGGQAAMNKLLFSRKSMPARVGQGIGSFIDKQKGLFGSALAPLLIEAKQ